MHRERVASKMKIAYLTQKKRFMHFEIFFVQLLPENSKKQYCQYQNQMLSQEELYSLIDKIILMDSLISRQYTPSFIKY